MPRESALGLGREDSEVYRLRVPKDLLAEWKIYAGENRDTAPEALRALMRGLLKHQGPALKPKMAVPAKAKAVTDDVDRRKRRVELQLTESEHRALSELAEERECSVQYWIVSLIRAALTNGITVGAAELKALGQSNYQLSAIGRNLNQIAHHINADSSKNLQKLKGEQIEELVKGINKHRGEVQALIRASSERWVIKDA